MTPRDRRPLDESQRRLAARYVPLARSMARPFRIAWPALRDEFESAAMLGLVEAAESFDPDRHVRFATFARHRIAGALRDACRAESRHRPLTDGPRLASADEEPAGARVLGVADEDPVGSSLEAADALEALLAPAPLTAEQRYVCRRFYSGCEERRALARHLGISRSKLWAIHRVALAALARCLSPAPPEEA